MRINHSNHYLKHLLPKLFGYHNIFKVILLLLKTTCFSLNSPFHLCIIINNIKNTFDAYRLNSDYYYMSSGTFLAADSTHGFSHNHNTSAVPTRYRVVRPRKTKDLVDSSRYKHAIELCDFIHCSCRVKCSSLARGDP